MALAPKLIVAATDKIVFCGDSITFFGWWFHLIGMSRRATDLGDAPGRSGYFYSSGPPAGMSWVNSGVSGDKIADIQAAVASRITAYGAQCLVMAIGVNDVRFSTGDSAFSTSFNATIDAAIAAQPSLKILSTGIFVNGEDLPGAVETDIANKNAIQLATMVRVGGTYADVHTPLVTWEGVNNPGHAASGFLTADGFHPNAIGNSLISEWVYPYVQFPGR